MSQYFSLFFINGLVIGSIYALIALGFNVIYSTTGVINFAQGAFVMIGGITAAFLSYHHGFPLYLSIIIGVFSAGIIGFLSYHIALKPAKKASHVTFIIITIALSIILESIASFIFGTDPYVLKKLSDATVSLPNGRVDVHSLIVLPVTALMMILLFLFFKYTQAGINMRACADNKDGAKLCGISVTKTSAMAFALSAGLAGVGGVMITPILGMQYDSGIMLGLKGFSAAIIGGMGNPIGCVAGGILLGILEQFIGHISSGYRDILALVIVIFILLLRPKGLLGK